MILIALTLGLLGSLHCLFMCGPLVMGVSRLSGKQNSSMISYALIYNIGRILAYVLMGGIFALIGKGFSLIGLQQVLSIFTGILLLILVGLSLDLERVIFRLNRVRSFYTNYGTYLNKQISSLARQQPFLLGALNGLLPCGMVYIALAGALGTSSLLKGGLFMFSFGLGTLPVMMLLMTGWQRINVLKGIKRGYVIPAGQAILGIYLVFRGFATSLPDTWF